MDGSTKIILILFILVATILNFSKLSKQGDDKIQAILDESTKRAVRSGELELPDNIVPIESKDCEGTQWIKQQGCSLNGKVMDGTEDSCGPGKEIWILDPNHKDFKPSTGDGKCEPQQRDCTVTCPKPCEGNTWKNTGKCVRKEYDTMGNVKEIILDGTAGKCGEGITELNLDTTAPDYKPPVGSGTCVMTKGGYCNVPCPKPEPPKCNSYTGWVENVGLGCVRSRDDQRKVGCGEKGEKMSFNVATDAKNCPELVKWEECTGAPCPINCEGGWSKWSDPKSDEPCGVQPYIERKFTVTKAAQYGGKSCDYNDGVSETRNSGTPKDCCIQNNDWAMKPGTCGADGLAIYTQTYKENKVGGCPTEVKSKKMACCYQKSDWTDTTKCNSVGRKSQKQTTVGNCPPSVKTRTIDCKYIGEWVAVGGCSTSGKQTYTRTVVNGDEKTQKTENCCYQLGNWTNSGGCKSNGKQTQKQTTANCPAGTDTKEIDCCYTSEWTNSGSCKSNGKQTQKRTIKNCPVGTLSTREVNCCYTTGWSNSGSCKSDGKQTQKRTVKNCPGESSTQEINCCYTSGWSNSGSCKSDGKQTQTRTVKNCPGESSSREINCCYKTGWTNSGSCKSNGKQTQKRTVKNCPGESSTQEINCCYTSGWSNSGGCKSNGKQTQTRTVKNCPTGTSSSREINCCYASGWSNSGGCKSNGKQTQTRTVRNCTNVSPSREIDCCYTSGWSNSGSCKSDGKQDQTRTVRGSCGRNPPAKTQSVDCEYLGPWEVVKQYLNYPGRKIPLPDCNPKTSVKQYKRVTKNSNQATTKSEPCCYIGGFKASGAWGACDGSNRYRPTSRFVSKNCPSGTVKTSTESQTCNHCEGSWGEWSFGPERASCSGNPKFVKDKTRTYTVTKAAKNGGNACPHTDGHKETVEVFNRLMNRGEMFRECGYRGVRSDPRLKSNITPLRSHPVSTVYSWTWNDTATRLYGLRGDSIGFLTTEVPRCDVSTDMHGYEYIKSDSPTFRALCEVRREHGNRV
jgi:hypothetical protein